MTQKRPGSDNQFQKNVIFQAKEIGTFYTKDHSQVHMLITHRFFTLDRSNYKGKMKGTH